MCDPHAEEHLAELLAAVNAENGGTVPALVPISVQGDGNCLFHAVSRALIGYETLYAVLREAVFKELTTHRDWHIEHAFGGSAEAFDDEMRNADRNGSFVPVQHLVALANVIKRPVVLLSSLEDMRLRADVAGTTVYLPGRLDTAHCCPNPLLLAWSSPARNHFVPLCRTREGPAAPTLPPACRPPPDACLPNGRPEFSVERYIPVGCWHLTGTTEEQLPPRALAKPGKYEAFQAKLVQKTAQAAYAALVAAEPIAAANAVAADDFKGTASGGMLAVSACAVLEATRVYHSRTHGGVRDALLDSICGPEYAKLLAALPHVPAAALCVCVAKELLEQLQMLNLQRQVSVVDQDSLLRRIVLGLELQNAQEELAEAEQTLEVCKLEASAAAQAQAAQAAQAAQTAHAARLERTASVNTAALLKRLASESISTPLPRWAPRGLGRCVALAFRTCLPALTHALLPPLQRRVRR